MYHEDVDLSLRLRLAGGRLGVEPAAVVDHDYEFAKGAAKWRLLERNRWATIVRCYPGAAAGAARARAARHRARAARRRRRRRVAAAEARAAAPRRCARCRGCCASAARSRRARDLQRRVRGWLTPDLDSPFLGAPGRSRRCGRCGRTGRRRPRTPAPVARGLTPILSTPALAITVREMPLSTLDGRQGPSPARRAARSTTPARRRPRAPLELAGYALIALGVAAVMALPRPQRRPVLPRRVDLHAKAPSTSGTTFRAAYRRDPRPGTAGRSASTSTLIAPFLGPVQRVPPRSRSSTPLNVLSADEHDRAGLVLLPRCIIDVPVLRVLGVALAVAVPWLAIGAHQLAENLAFPLYVWTILRDRARPPSTRGSARSWSCSPLIGADDAVPAQLRRGLRGARGRPWPRPRSATGWTTATSRPPRARQAPPARPWPIAAAHRARPRRRARVRSLLGGSSARSGATAAWTATAVASRLWGEEAARPRAGSCSPSPAPLVIGSFVLPFVLGLVVALAGTAGRLGRRFTVPAVARAHRAPVDDLVGVSVYTINRTSLEERYVFVSSARRWRCWRSRRWSMSARCGAGSPAAGAVTVWILYTGVPYLAAGPPSDFFAAPAAGATWSRAIDHRVRDLENDLFGLPLLHPCERVVPDRRLLLALLVLWCGLPARRRAARARER